MADQDNRAAGFEIDGKSYPIPRLDTITLDEERILYLYADTVLSDFMPARAEADKDEQLAVDLAIGRRIRNPEFKRALVHIAYRRKHSDVSDGEIQQAIGRVLAIDVDEALLRGDADSPPAMNSQKPPESKSDTREPSNSTDSGSPSESGSGPADRSPAPTGTIESGTSSPGAAPIALVN